jgi:hypothetical protein
MSSPSFQFWGSLVISRNSLAWSGTELEPRTLSGLRRRSTSSGHTPVEVAKAGKWPLTARGLCFQEQSSPPYRREHLDLWTLLYLQQPVTQALPMPLLYCSILGSCFVTQTSRKRHVHEIQAPSGPSVQCTQDWCGN